MGFRLRSIVLLLVGMVFGIVPLFAANFFMRDYVQRQGETQLEEFAAHTLAKTESSIQRAIDVFSALPHYRVPACDKALQDRFRGMILRHPVLHDVGLIYNGEFMYCSSIQESARFYPVSANVLGKVPHLSYIAMRHGLTNKSGLLIKWNIRDYVSLGGFILIDSFELDTIKGEARAGFVASVHLENGAIVAQSTPRSRFKKRAPFGIFKADPDWSKDLIVRSVQSDRYPIGVTMKIPLQTVWAEFDDVMNVINGMGLLVGAMIVLFFAHIGLRKPKPYDSIEAGIKRREFIPYYQPIIDIQSGKLAGCEVLVRWRKPDGTILAPGHFIDVAEASGLATPMTTLLMEQVAEDLSASYAARPQLKAAINLFNKHFDDLKIVGEIERIFGNSGVDFKQLVFEITERQPLENLDRARAIISRMQRLGARVALDDAGTGHGGFAYLQMLGMDIIKIDKLFVDSVTGDSERVPIVDSIQQMAKAMNMVVVAEGVETEDQLAYLRRSGIDEAQGYLFAPPLPARAYLKLVEAMKAGRSNNEKGEEGRIVGEDNSVSMPTALIAQ